MEKKLIYVFKISQMNIFTLANIVTEGYNNTGMKFSITFNGSKGYLDNIEISCEGKQKSTNNIIQTVEFITEEGKLEDKTICVFYSEEEGVTVVINEISNW